MKNINKQSIQEFSFLYILPAYLWQVLFLWIPFFIVLWFSFVSDSVWTMDNYRAICNSSHVRIIGRSMMFALANAFFCLLCAYPVAYFLAVKVKRFKNFLIFLLVLPFWTNMLVQVYAWLFLLGNNGLIESFLRKMGLIQNSWHIAHSLIAVFFVMVYCYIPFMILPIYTVLERIPRQLREASADLGATPWQTFIHVTLPLSVSGIKTGFLLVMVPSFGEFVIPELIGGAKYMLSGSLISYYFLVSRNNGIGSAFTIFSGFILLIVAYLFYRFLPVMPKNEEGDY